MHMRYSDGLTKERATGAGIGGVPRSKGMDGDMIHLFEDRATRGGALGDRLIPLQPLVHTEAGICTEPDLYIRQKGPVGISRETGRIEFGAGGTAEFNTYFNMFSLEKWRRYCKLKDIRLVLEGEGRFELGITQAPPGVSFERVYNELVTLEPGQPLEIDLSALPTVDKGGLLYFDLRALSAGAVTSACWMTAQQPLRAPRLVASITTFKREAAVSRSVARFREFIASSPLQEHIHLIVVDNGKSAGLKADKFVTPVENENLGGAGGFTRGAIEAQARGATHCLFMDDDATIHMSTLERVWTFLAYVVDDSTAIVGALAKGSNKWQLWENGATFKATCHRHMGDLDLRDFFSLRHMEMESYGYPDNFYGGWWFFAFPMAHMKRLPFPFFVRGDDVSFSLVHDFHMVTLPGVITFQDADFTDKISPLTEYLDLRSHLVHHLSLPSMDIGALRTAKIAAWFFTRTLCFCRYETLEALNMAVEDVMAGPDFFATHADLAQRRADIKALTQDETYKPYKGPLPQVTPEDVVGWRAILMKFTLNGHFVPFFTLFASRKVLLASEQGLLFRVWGAKQVIHIDRMDHTAQTVTHSKAKAFRQGWRMLGNGIRFLRKYNQLKHDWQGGYQKFTTRNFWQKMLKLS